MKKLMTIAAALLCGTLLAEELNVASGETVTLTENKTVDGGTVSGTLILESGVTLTLAKNIFESSATVEMRGATIEGFSQVHDVSLPCKFAIANGTENAMLNIHDAADEWNANGCNVTMSGTVEGRGTLTLRSTGRGFIIDGNWSEFEGTLNLDMSGNYFSGRINTGNLQKATVNVVSGQVKYYVWGGTAFGHLNVSDEAEFNVDRDADTENILNLYGDSVLGGTFTGSALDVNVYNGAKVTVDSSIARVNIDNGALSGNGTIGKLTTWGNPVNISNPQSAVLKIENRADGDTGILMIVGEAGSRSGNPVLEVTDTSKFNVQLSSALAADGWKLKEESGVYSIYKNGLMIVIR